MKKIILLLCMTALAFSFSLYAGGRAEEAVDEKTVVMADASWDSILVHNRIVEFIFVHGYDGYNFDFIPGDTIPLFNGLVQGNVDVNMESWHENILEIYEEAIEEGSVVNVGANMPQAPQGWYVPRYMIEGDPDRGIEPMAPGLEHISDLPDYWELVKDPENQSKGVILVGPPGWAATERSIKLMEDYGLKDTYNSLLPGSGTALAASMVGAFEAGDPWVGYYWEPTAIIGRLDMVMLPGSEWPPTSVDILMNADAYNELPEMVEFFEKYSTTIEENNLTLAAMEDNNLDSEETAIWFLENFEDTWTQWVDDEAAQRVKTALQ